MAKNISKSVRLSNDVYEYVCDFDGNGFNEKFENIVLFCMKTEIERKKRLDEIEKLIKSRSEQLDNINRDLDTARRATNIYKRTMETLKYI